MSSSGSIPINEQRIAGSLAYPFKLAIIGGGPSGCSILVRAARIGMLPELCQFSSSDGTDVVRSVTTTSESENSLSSPSSPTAKAPTISSIPSSPQKGSQPASPSKASINVAPQQPPISYAGVCVIDGGTMERIGGGRLQDYVINSNTWINKFATNVVEEKLDNLPPETIKGTPFDSLLHSGSTKQVEDFGNKTGPLKLVGHFLRDVGQRAVAAVQAYPSSSKFYIRTNVESMQRVVENGTFKCWKLVLVPVTNQTTEGNNSNGTVQERKEVYALHVAMATGGHQTLPHFTNTSYRQKTMLSDVVCTMEGVELLKTKLHRYLRSCHNNGIAPTGRVVVIGGSHSAFSAAWVCLNLVNEDSTIRLAINSSSNNSNVASSSLISTTSAPISLNSHNQLKFGPSGVCILHRSAIRVFYATRADADHDHYPESSIVVNRITGNINPFGGIRGDAKELWRNIRSTKEGRVRLLQVKHIPLATPPVASDASHPTAASASAPLASSSSSSAALKQSIVEKMLDEAVVIIWAAGYSTNMIPIYDHDGSRIHVRMSKGQAEVDEHANLLLSDQHHGQSPLSGFLPSMTLPSYASLNNSDFQGIPVGNLYGSGLGYGLKATLDNGEPDGASGRADGVAVYLKRGATLILANVLGNKVYGGLNIHSWEERNQALKKQQKQQDQSALLLNMAQIAASSESGSSKTPLSSSSNSNKSPTRRSSSFMTPTRVATAHSGGSAGRVSHHHHHNPHSHAAGAPPSTAIGLRSPQAPQTAATATPSSVQGRRPASAGRIRVGSTSTSSSESSSANNKPAAAEKRPAQTHDKVNDKDKDKEREKMALIRNVATHVQLQQPAETTSNNNQTSQSEVASSVSEPCTPSTTHHPTTHHPTTHHPIVSNNNNNKSVALVKPLPGSVGRTIVSSVSTPPRSGAAKANTDKAQKMSHAHALRASIDNAMLTSNGSNNSTKINNNNNNGILQKTSNSADRKHNHNHVVVKPLKPMPGPLPLPMGSANFTLPPHQHGSPAAAVSSLPSGHKSPAPHSPNGQNKALLSSTVK